MRATVMYSATTSVLSTSADARLSPYVKPWGMPNKIVAMQLTTVPADGFCEWRKTAKPKLPFAIALKDGRPFTFAGPEENGRDPESGEWQRTCTIITGEPNALERKSIPVCR